MDEIEKERLKSIGTNIKMARTMMGLSQEELAKRSGIGRRTITDIELGKINSSLGTLFKLCDALQMHLDIRFIPMTEG